MSWAAVFVVALLIGFVVINVGVICGSLDALGQPREAWERTGFRRNAWVWQAFGVFFMPAAFIYSGLYFFRVRPRLIAAAGELAAQHAAVPSLQPCPATLDRPQTDRLRIRIPLPVIGTMALALACAWAVATGLFALTDGWHSVAVWPSLGVVAGSAVGVLQNMAFGITLTRRDLVMRGLLRRHVAWRDVVAITQESTWGARYVRLWTRNGHRRRLRAPITQFGVGRERFDEDFAVLQNWWRTYNPANF